MKVKPDTYSDVKSMRPSRACATEAKVPTRGWNKERRAAQAARCKEQKLWQYARGPKTAAGKARSAQNACKHYMRSAAYNAELKRLRSLFRDYRAYLSRVKVEAKLCALSTSSANRGTLCRL